MRKTVHEKVQEQTFNRLLALPENAICSDCTSRGPCWVSLDFGVFICFNCSGKLISLGEHRALGMHITRVRSCKIDNWTQEELDLMQSIGNERANLYWEGDKSKGGFSKPSSSASAQQRKAFLKEKYIKKMWIDPAVGNPVDLFHKALQAGQNPSEYIKKHTGAPTAGHQNGGQSPTPVQFKKPEMAKLGTREENQQSKSHTAQPG